MSNLPPEIVHLILQNVREDALTLKQCTLVNRTWLHEAQPLLFSTRFICIHFIDQTGDSTHTGRRSPFDFEQMATRSPHLRPLIRTVKLHWMEIARDTKSRHQWSIVDLFSPLLSIGVGI
jgi:hypothetical protein